MENKKEMLLRVPGISYPKDLKLWRTDIKPSERLSIINPEDFPLDPLLGSLGIADSPLRKSFGIFDQEEIKERSAIMKFLVDNPEIISYISRELPVYSDWLRLPTEEWDFLRYFDPKERHNPFWKRVRKLSDLLDQAGELPSRLQILNETLKLGFFYEEDEQAMSEIVSHRVKDVAAIEGLVKLSVWTNESKVNRLEFREGKIHGHRLFSYSAEKAKTREYPKWTLDLKHPLTQLRFNWIVKKSIDLINGYYKWQASEEMVITKETEGLITDIKAGVLKELKKLDWKNYEISGSTLNVYFSYSDKGLRLHIFGIEPKIGRAEEAFCFDTYDYYSQIRLEAIEEAEEEYIKAVTEDRRALRKAFLRIEIEKQDAEFFKRKFFIDSPNTDSEHRWFAIANLYESKPLKSAHRALGQYRNFFAEQMKDLVNIASLANSFNVRSELLDAPLCCPEILDGEDGQVQFEGILPLHLLSHLREKGEKLVPIKGLPIENGQIICLTGRHGGGKTATLNALAENIYLAQSGLLVFGESFALDIKKKIGMIFIEKTDDSTFQVVVEKIKKVVEGAKKAKENEVILVIDELGIGTNEEDGYQLGQRLLKKLKELGVSVVFSTQIADLAEFSRKELGASCFRLDANHQAHSGIGDGQAKEIIEETGLGKLLR